MRYDSYRYIEPPRTDNKVMESMLDFYEKRKWIAQVKKNGTNTVIFVPPKGDRPFAKTRHTDDQEHKVWQFSEASIAAFEAIQTREWSVFNAELLHSKGNGIRDTHYVFDILVDEGEYLLGSTVQQRQERLQGIFRTHVLKGPPSHFVVNANTWIAKNHTNSFRRLFANLENEDEGLFLKNPSGKLMTRDNGSWGVKCRHPRKNFGF